MLSEWDKKSRQVENFDFNLAEKKPKPNGIQSPVIAYEYTNGKW